jgi:thioredoxin reductase (NADPH)
VRRCLAFFCESCHKTGYNILMEIKDTYDVIIIGGGVAGLTAGLYCQRAALKTVLFEKGLLGGQIAISKEVENYPGMRDITGFELAEKLVDHARVFGLNIMQEEVVSVTAGTDLHAVRLANGDVYQSTAIILALGGSARKLGVPGEAEYLGRGVSYCATCDGMFFRGKTVVVVGGGDTAVEEALFLSRVAGKVYLMHRRSPLRAGKLLQNRLAAEPRIEVIKNTIVTVVKGDGNAVTAVSCESSDTGEKGDLPVEGVFIFIGYTPNTALVPPGVRKSEQGFVITNDRCETSVPGIFAVGDLRLKSANQIVIAAGDGATGGLGAAHYVETKRVQMK